MDKDEKSQGNQKKKRNGSVISIFMHVDGVDLILMTLGFLGAVGDGISMPVRMMITSKLMKDIGSSGSLSMATLIDGINKNAVVMCYIACATWVACFFGTGGYCWARTAERQASRLRARYLKAILRQDVSYFDSHVTSNAEVITNVSNDSIVIQEVISEKVPTFVMNVATFVGAYVVAFALLWQLAIVGFPFVALLVIPGLMYGRALTGFARKKRVEYNKANIIVEQAMSAVRTVYSFVGERKTVTDYSAALQETLNLGLKQGLAKGLAIGSSGISFAIWAFMSFYGSRLVMYHGAQGGTVFVVGASERYMQLGLFLGKTGCDLRILSQVS